MTVTSFVFSIPPLPRAPFALTRAFGGVSAARYENFVHNQYEFLNLNMSSSSHSFIDFFLFSFICSVTLTTDALVLALCTALVKQFQSVQREFNPFSIYLLLHRLC